MTPADRAEPPAPVYPSPPPAGRRGLTARGALILAALAFLIGLAATVYVMANWDGWRGWLGRSDTPAVAAPTGQPPARLSEQPGASVAPASSGTAVASDPYGAPSLDTALETAAREAQLSARIAQLEARLAAIDVRASAASGNASRAEGLLVAFAARRALDRGLGLGYIESQLRARFGESQPRAVAVVIQASRNPVRLEALRIGLDELAPELTTGTDETSWWDSVRGELANLIVVRRTGTPSPRPTDRITRARRMLEGGQVDAALAEVARLPGRDKAAAWMDAARRYNQARRALDVLETAAILEPQNAAVAAPATPPLPAAATPTLEQLP